MKTNITLGQYLADKLAYGMGSWSFLIFQSIILLIWVLYNTVASNSFDAYPFVFLNLLLSFQAAYAAPIIMMSNNRQEDIDRQRNIDIYNLEKSQHDNIKKLIIHIDKHFDSLYEKVKRIEEKTK